MINRKLLLALVTIALLIVLSYAIVSRRQTDPQPVGPPTSSPTKRNQPAILRIETEQSKNGGAKPVVLGRLLEEQVPFLLDTGGQSSMLTEDWKDRVTTAGQIEASDSNGKRIMHRTVPMRLFLGDTSLEDVRFSIPGKYLQLTHGKRVWATDGSAVLGQDILSRFHVIIDGPKQELQLLQGDNVRDGQGWVSFEGFWGTQHLTVSASGPGNRKLRVFVDTGYELSRIDKELAASQPNPIDIRIGGNHIVGYTPSVLKGGDITISNPEKGDIVIHCTLGWDVLRSCRLEVSYKHQKLRVTQEKGQQGNAPDRRSPEGR